MSACMRSGHYATRSSSLKLNFQNTVRVLCLESLLLAKSCLGLVRTGTSMSWSTSLATLNDPCVQVQRMFGSSAISDLLREGSSERDSLGRRLSQVQALGLRPVRNVGLSLKWCYAAASFLITFRKA